MAVRDEKILKLLNDKVDSLKISHTCHVDISCVLDVMKKHGIHQNKYKKVFEIKDEIDRNVAYGEARHKISKKMNIIKDTKKLARFLKKPRTIWECLGYMMKPYRELYGMLKRIKIIKMNAMSPISLELVVAQKHMKDTKAIFQWRKRQVDDLFRRHNACMRKIKKVSDSHDGILHVSTIYNGIFTDYILQDINIHLDYISEQMEYPQLILPLEDFFNHMNKPKIAGFSKYQSEIILGKLLNRKLIDLIGFKKESLYFTNKGTYPLFIINNEAFRDSAWGIRKALLRYKITVERDENTISNIEWENMMKVEIDHLSTEEVVQDIFSRIIDTFEPSVLKHLKEVCWENPTILTMIYIWTIFYKNEYVPVTNEYVMEDSKRVALEQTKHIRNNKEREHLTEKHYLFNIKRWDIDINNKVHDMLSEGFFKYYQNLTLEDVFDALCFFEVRYSFAFYMLCRILSINVFAQQSDYYKKRMKPREPEKYPKPKKSKRNKKRKRRKSKSKKLTDVK